MKKIISALLVVVMLLSVAPFSNTVKTALGTTQASALETVDGSFDYLVNYIMDNSDLQDEDSFVVSNLATSSGGYLLIYNYKTRTIQWTNFSLDDDLAAIAVLCIEKIGNRYNFEIAIVDDSISIVAGATINPQTYHKEKLTFTYEFSDSRLYSITDELNENSSDILAKIIEQLDSYLKENVGISLGNFGFSKISAAQSLPKPADPNVKTGDFSLNYKQTAKVRPIISPDNKNVKYVEYSTSNSSVVSVDKSGNVTAVSCGSATITCKVVDVAGNKYVFDYDVTVSYSVIQWIIRILLLGFLWY